MKAKGLRFPEYRTVVIYGALLLLSVGAVVAGFYLEHQNKLAAHILTEFGIAGFIGFVLAITIERLSAEEFRKSAEEHVNEIKKNVFHYVYGHSIPEEITQEIDEQILRAVFVRREAHISYTLDHVRRGDAPAGYVLVNVVMHYVAENITKVTQNLPVAVIIEKAPDPVLNGDVKIISVKVEGGGCGEPFEYEEADLRALQTEDDIEITFKKEVPVAPGKGTRVVINTQTVKYLNGGSDTGFVTNHVCGLDMIVQAPADICVFAIPLTSGKFDDGWSHKPQAGHYHWQLKRPLLTYQGFLLYWTPKSMTKAGAGLGAPLDLTREPAKLTDGRAGPATVTSHGNGRDGRDHGAVKLIESEAE